MFKRLILGLLLLPNLCFAQVQDRAIQQNLLEELKALRASVESLGKDQKVLMALTRLQIYESRLTVLEAQRLQYLRQEQDLAKEIEVSRTPRTGQSSLPTLVQVLPDMPPVVRPPDPTADQARSEEASRRIEVVRRDRENVEQRIGELKIRIASLEKYLDGSSP